PTLPQLDPAVVLGLLGPAAAVAGLAAIESLLSARVASAMADTGPVDPDRELVGQGLASIAAGLFGGMPATGAIARTAVNVRSGARSRLASISHALVLLAIILVGAAAVSRIPVAALAGVLMVTATRMISRATVLLVLRSSRSAALTFVVTAVITVAFDLIIAVLIGLSVATLFALRTLARSSGVHREPLPGPPRPGDEEIALFRIDGALFFGAAQRLVDRVLTVDDVTVVVLRLSQLQLLDVTGARILVDLVHTLERRGVTVLIKGIRREHLRMLTRVGVISSLRHENHLFDRLDDAVAHARDHVRRARAGERIPVPEREPHL
ncbi:MAG TPA: SulP family inorganic anion transporter, partial [Microlunatus sp.]|nr:SulP family inorganic anion transporter [Microlunatus sp.]